MEEVWDCQEPAGAIERRRAEPIDGTQLVEGVQFHELHARRGEDLLARHDGKRAVELAVGASVAVGDGGGEQLSLSIEQREIDPPGIDADAHDLVAERAVRLPQAEEDVRPEVERLPV